MESTVSPAQNTQATQISLSLYFLVLKMLQQRMCANKRRSCLCWGRTGTEKEPTSGFQQQIELVWEREEWRYVRSSMNRQSLHCQDYERKKEEKAVKGDCMTIRRYGKPSNGLVSSLISFFGISDKRMSSRIRRDVIRYSSCRFTTAVPFTTRSKNWFCGFLFRLWLQTKVIDRTDGFLSAASRCRLCTGFLSRMNS